MAITFKGSAYNVINDTYKAEQEKNNGGFLGGVGYLLEKTALGLTSGLEGIVDFTAGGFAKMFGADDWAEQVMANDWVNYEHADEWYDPGEGWKFAGDVFGGVGTSIPAIGGAIAGGAIIGASGGTAAPAGIKLIGASLAPLVGGLAAAGNSTKEAYHETGELGGKEFGYGALSGFTEAGVEFLTQGAGNLVGRTIKSVSQKISKETVETVSKSGAKTFLKHLGKDFLSEGIEEGLSEALSPVYKRLTYNPMAESATAEEIGYAALVGGLSGLVMTGGSAAISRVGNTGANLISGNKAVESGSLSSILDDARRITEVETANDTGYASFQEVKTTYEKLSESLKTTDGKISTVHQKMLLGQLKRANTASIMMPYIERSAVNILNNVENVAQRFSELGMSDENGNKLTFTAKEILSGIDTSLLHKADRSKAEQKTLVKSIRSALSNNSTLATLAVMDATGHIQVDGKRFREAALNGSLVANQVDLERFLQTAKQTDIDALSKALDIPDWSAITMDEFRSKVAHLAESGAMTEYAKQSKRIKAAIENKLTPRKPLPHVLEENITDGLYQYSDESGKVNIAVFKEGEAYYIYDYDSGNITRSLSMQDVNEVLNLFWKDQAENAVNGTSEEQQQTAQSQEIDYAAKDREIDAAARESIPEYHKLSDPAQQAVRRTIRQAEAHGISSEDAMTMARVSARSGLNIEFNGIRAAQGDANIQGNTIYIDPNAPKDRIRSRLLLHEAGHALLREKGGKKLLTEAFKHIAPERSQEIAKKYMDLYEAHNISKENYMPIVNEEITAAYIEDVLGDTNAWEYILTEEPTMKEKFLGFFRRAARDYSSDSELSAEARKLLRRYKKLFDTFSQRNYQNNAIESPAQNHQESIRFSVSDNKVIVDTDREIFDGVERKDYGKTVRDYMRDHFRGKEINDIRFNKQSEQEFIHSTYSHNVYGKWNGVYEAKMQLATELDKLMSVATFIGHEDALHPKAHNMNGYDRYGFSFVMDGVDFYGELLIAIDENGNRNFYDVVNVKKGIRDFSAESTAKGPEPALNGRYALPEDYTYESLIKKDDLKVTTLPEAVPMTADGKIDKKAVLARGKLNARKQKNSNNTDASTYVYVDDIGLDVLLGTKGMQHGLVRSETTALAVMKIGDILKNSVAVNELNGSNERNSEMSYVLLGACQDGEGLCVVRSIVSKLLNNVTEIDVYQLSAAKGIKTKIPNSALKRGAAVTEQSSLISSGSSVISIADLLENVKSFSLANEIFSKDVLDKLGVSRSIGTLSEDVRYALPETEKAPLPDNPPPEIVNVENMVAKDRPKYKAGWKDYLWTKAESIYIDTVDEQHGIEIYFRRQGGMKPSDAKAFLNAARSVPTKAQVMISNLQYNIFSDSLTKDSKPLGDGLMKILEPVKAMEKTSPGAYKAFNAYLMHFSNIDTMTLRTKSIIEHQKSDAFIQAKADLEKVEAEIRKTENKIDLLGRKMISLRVHLKELNAYIQKFKDSGNLNTAEIASQVSEAAEIRKQINSLNGEILNERKNHLSKLRSKRTELKKTIAGTPMKNKSVFGSWDFDAKKSLDEIKRYEAEYPEFHAIAEKVWAYFHNLLDMRVEAGLISSEDAAIQKKYNPHYIPKFRAFPQGATLHEKGVEVSSTVKRMKGGKTDIIDIAQSGAEQTQSVIRWGYINQIANRICDIAERTGDVTYVEIVSEEDVKTEEIYDIPLKGTELRPKENLIEFFRNGKKVTMKVSNEIFKGFEGINQPTVEFDSALTKFANWCNQKFKRVVTSYNPGFMITNPIKDIQDALLNSKHRNLFVKKFPKTFKLMAKNSSDWKLFCAMGGFSASVFNTRDGYVGSVGKRGFSSSKCVFATEAEGLAKVWDKIKMPGKVVLTVIENANAVVEQATRFAEFLASIEAGDDVQTAIYNSAEVTTNFGRRGHLAKKFNATLMPFLNPAIQGFDKLFRNVSDVFHNESGKKIAEALAHLLLACLAVGIGPSLFNHFMLEDDEEYQKMRDADKENNFIIKAGNTYIKIPRGRLAGVMGGSATRAVRRIKGDQDAFDGYLQNVTSQITPAENMTRTILSPFLDMKNNVTWYGTAIEGREFENVRPKDRYDENTSSIAVALGKTFNYSPKKIHYLLDQYSGIIGDVILPRTTQKAEKDYFTSKFTIDPVASNKLSTKFYKLYDEAQYAKTNYDRLVEAQGKTADADDTAVYQVSYLNKVKSAIGKLYDEKSKIQASDLSKVEKLQQTRVIQVLINQAYESAIENYEAYTETIKATKHISDEKLRKAEITRRMFGAEQALEEYNKKTYEKMQVIQSAGFDYETLYYYYFSTRDLESDLDRNGDPVSGSKRKKVISAINSLDVSADQKLLLIAAKGYSLQDHDIRGLTSSAAKRRLLKYILSLKGKSQAQKAELAELCGFEVKNGKILTKNLYNS